MMTDSAAIQTPPENGGNAVERDRAGTALSDPPNLPTPPDPAGEGRPAPTPAAHGSGPGSPEEKASPGGIRGTAPDGQQAGAKLTLRSAAFRQGREQAWRSLDDMAGRVETAGISALSADEVQALPLLYRSVMSSLSVARTIVLDRNLLLYLENLSLRAYLAVYGPRVGVMEGLAAFFTRDFPASVRAFRRHLAVAFAALAIGAVAGYLLVQSDANYFTMLVPEGLAQDRGPGSTRADLYKDELFAPWPGFLESFVLFATALFRHNAVIGIFSFGLGFALGIPTLLLLAYNGLVLGAFVALHAARGLTLDCIGWLSVHGVTETLAMLLCGAAGLVVAEKVLFPGPLPRLESLARHGRRAAGVAAGSVALFFIAGLFEGGFRQLISFTPGRYAFGLGTGLLWLLYFARCGKDTTHDPAE